jgi:cation transport regulator ChaC
VEPSTELASDFTVADYRALRPTLDQANPTSWDTTLRALRRRIDERFLKPIRELGRVDNRHLPYRPGFAILALDCLLIDTIQSFREGRVATGEASPAQSFKNFLSAPRFSDFKSKDRGDFFHHVRNGILHNGETRKDWKVRIDTTRILERTPTMRTINRRLFHAAIIREWRDLYQTLRSGNQKVRAQFLRRMDSIAGLPIQQLKNSYFAYGSNLLGQECQRTAPDAQEYGVAFLPGYRLEFTKHSTTRKGDAATIRPDPNSMVWGFVYRVHDKDREHLRAREAGYNELPETTVYLGAPGDDPTPITAFTFAATQACPNHCGPHPEYLDLIIQGARTRQLPEAYQQRLADLRQQPEQTTDS